jgi:hypothetical protein
VKSSSRGTMSGGREWIMRHTSSFENPRTGQPTPCGAGPGGQIDGVCPDDWGSHNCVKVIIDRFSLCDRTPSEMRGPSSMIRIG